jgi:two-component system C4-dicarboxylate transport sensor histidine kinase DctB
MILDRRRIFGCIAALALAVAAFGAVIAPYLERHYLRQQADRNIVPLRLAAAGLRAALDRYAPLPALIAQRPALAQLLADPDNTALVASVNEDLRQTAATVRASDVFVMDLSGRTRSAASFRQQKTFVGRNFSYQAYFRQALGGNHSSFQIHGTTTGERGYFYAAPVRDGSRIVGVLAVKFNIAAFDSVWRGADSEFIVSDGNDFVLMSSRPDWHFRAMRPLSEATRKIIATNLQYPIDRIDLLPITTTALNDRARHVSVGGTPAESFVMTSLMLPERGWTMASMAPTRPAAVNTARTLLIGGLSAVVILGGLLALLLRQARQVEARAREQQAKRLLEEAVADRTADVSRALADLKRTQTDLIQAAKMSGLGQMSAALAHEFNQPLTAVKTYAENARALLERDRIAEASDTLGRISGMVDRMASISTHLRNFARRPQQVAGPVMLGQVVQDAIAVMDMRLAAEGARIDFIPSEDDIRVIGGAVRLQQVFVNLINNALDAVEGQPHRSVEVCVTGPRVEVRDRGAGIDPDAGKHLFDPFFTTKPTGKGLGLGLSISYNIVTDFGGTLTAADRPGGGAVFAVTLLPAPPLQVAAQ